MHCFALRKTSSLPSTVDKLKLELFLVVHLGQTDHGAAAATAAVPCELFRWNVQPTYAKDLVSNFLCRNVSRSIKSVPWSLAKTLYADAPCKVLHFHNHFLNAVIATTNMFSF